MLGCVVAAALGAPLATAQERPFQIRAGSTLTWDSNVFRLADGAPDPQAAQGKTGRSDRILSAYVGIGFNGQYSQQRIALEATQTATRYDTFSNLNNDALSYRGVWNWHLTPRVSGTLYANRTESLVAFEDIVQGLQRNLRVSSSRGLTVDGQLFGGWHVLAGASQDEAKNSTTYLAQPNSKQSGGEVGIRYVAPSQSSITFMQRWRNGDNTGQAVNPANFIGSGFSVRESELAVKWLLNPQSTLNGRLTQTERHDDNFSGRNFSGLGGELRFGWNPLAKLVVDVSASRNVAPWTQDTSASYRVDERFGVAPTWQFSEKIRFRMNAYRLASDYRGAVGPLAGPERHDVQRSVQAAVDWAPHRAVTVSVSLQRDRRSSNYSAFAFSDTIAFVSAALQF